MTHRFNGQTNNKKKKESRKLSYPEGSPTFMTERCVKKVSPVAQPSLEQAAEKHIPTSNMPTMFVSTLCVHVFYLNMNMLHFVLPRFSSGVNLGLGGYYMGLQVRREVVNQV